MKTRSPTLALLVPMVALACGGEPSGPGGITVSDLAGTWNAAQLLFTRISDNLQTDPIAEGGTSTLVIQASGSFTFTINFADGSSTTDSGTMEFDSENEDFLLVLFTGETVEDEFFFQLNGNAMSLNGITGFDFDGDGTDSAAGLIAAFIKA